MTIHSTIEPLGCDAPRVALPLIDRQILGLLEAGATPGQVADIGRWRGTWDRKKVERVIEADRNGDPHQHRPPGWVGNRLRRDRRPAPRVELTEKRAQVLDGLCRGDDLDVIAEQMNVTRGTVSLHVRTILESMGLKPEKQATKAETDQALRDAIDVAVQHAMAGWVRLYVVYVPTATADVAA
jgi:DNA-binding CsgD family transcriptional regulator